MNQNKIESEIVNQENLSVQNHAFHCCEKRRILLQNGMHAGRNSRTLCAHLFIKLIETIY